MVGTFTVGDNTHKIGDQYRDAWNQIKHVSDDYPDLEPLVALKPDFVYTGWAWGLDESKNITPDNLATYGIKTPLGLSAIYEVNRQPNPRGFLGPRLLPLTSLSNVLKTFGGADSASANLD